jgi:hypothetical protein
MTMYYSTICNKVSLVGMQLPEKYKDNFDVSSEGPTNFPLKTSKFSLYFSGSCIPTNEAMKACYCWHYLVHWHKLY